MPIRRGRRTRRGRPRRRTITRRTNNRRTRRPTSTVRIASSSTFIAPRVLTKLKYNNSTSAAITAGGFADIQMNINGLFDPEVALGGHQPYGFDQLMALYTFFRVFACSWIVSMPTTSDAMLVTVVPVNNAKTFANANEAAEWPRAISKKIFAGDGSAVFRGKIFLPRLAGVSPATYRADSTYVGSVSADLTEIMRLHIVGSGHADMTMRPNITLIFHCEFMDPVAVGQS